MHFSAYLLALCLAANVLSPFDLPAEEPKAAPSAIVWENGITPDLPAVEIAAPVPETIPSTYDEAGQVAELVNRERAKANLPALAYDAKLCEAAQVRAKEIVSLFAHERPDGSSCFTVLKEKGISYVACGENIAKGSQTPEAVMNGWMNSSGHKANILSTRFTKIGVAMVKVGNTKYWVQLFMA